MKLATDHLSSLPSGRTTARHDGASKPVDGEPGAGRVNLSRVVGQTVVTRLWATSPLKLFVPRQRQRSAWIITSNFGGGLVEGDHIDLTLHVGPGAIGYVGTQAATKVYRSEKNLGVTQVMRASIADQGLLVLAPDPVTCFAGAIYDQNQHFDLSGSGSLILIDWITAGRVAHGERWSLDRYRCRNDIYLDGVHQYGDATVLDRTFGPIGALFRTGPYNCLATLVLVGDQVESLARRFVDQIDALPVRPRESLIYSASTFEHGGVIRVAGVNTAEVAASLHDRLRHVADWLGEDPWARKC